MLLLLRRYAATVHDTSSFDAKAFGLPAAEAQIIDPQQRLLIETTWEAMLSLHAGADLSRYGRGCPWHTTCLWHDTIAKS